MKHIIRKSIGTILLTATFAIGNSVQVQASEESTTTTTTTSAGTISEFGPDGIVIKTTTDTDPVRYSSSKTTTYVDEDGKSVAIKTVNTGLPVTVYYTKVGDKLVASKVIVRKSVKVSDDGAGNTETTTTSSAGTISEFGPQQIVIKTQSSTEPLRYGYSKTTTYVDEDGKPVSIKTVKSGLPITVYYTKIGDKLMATKVIVRKAVVVPEATESTEKKTTTTTTTEEK